jgi:hypothetical protein
MMEKRTILTNVEATPDGTLFARLEMQIVDAGRVVARTPVRTPIEPGVAAEAHLAAVGAALTRDHGFPAPDAAAVDRVKRLMAVEHTPAVVSAFEAFKAARNAADDARDRAAKAANARDPKAPDLIEEGVKARTEAERAYASVLERVRGGSK